MTGTGSCEDVSTDDAPGPGYLLDGPTKINAATDVYGETSKEVTEATFDVKWESEDNPGLRTCYVSVLRTDGICDEPFKHNLLVGQHPIILDVPGACGYSVDDVSVECGPLEP